MQYFTDPLINRIAPHSFIENITLSPYQFATDFTTPTTANTFINEKDDYYDLLDQALGPYELRKDRTNPGDSNPFEGVSVPLYFTIPGTNKTQIREINSIFINRAALKLANLDYLFNITNECNVFLDIAAGPGGFTQYLQYRLPNARGFGVSKKYNDSDTVNRSLNWRRDALDLTRFTILDGKDGGGDLLKIVPEVIITIKIKEPITDLVVADGGMEDLKENDLYPLLVAEMYLGFSVLRKGGKMVVKMSSTSNVNTAQLIYLFSQTFTTIHLLKILTSRQMNTEQYLVGIDYLANTEVVKELENRYYKKNINIIPIKQGFDQWLTGRNDNMARLRRYLAQEYIKGKVWYEFANHLVLGLLDVPGPSLVVYPK